MVDNWTPITECEPLYRGEYEISYRCPDANGNFFWNIKSAEYVGHGIFYLIPSGKKLKNSVSAWRYIQDNAPYIPEDWDSSKDKEYWSECNGD